MGSHRMEPLCAFTPWCTWKKCTQHGTEPHTRPDRRRAAPRAVRVHRHLTTNRLSVSGLAGSPTPWSLSDAPVQLYRTFDAVENVRNVKRKPYEVRRGVDG